MEEISRDGSISTPYSWQFRQWAGGLFGLDLRSLATLRIGLGLLLLSDLALRSRDLVAHYTDDGVVPRSLGGYGQSHLQLHSLGGSASYEATLFVIAAVFALMLLVGYWTRLATFASWLLLCSLQARNAMNMDSGQDLLRLIMFWSMFLPLGARYSVDSALRIALPRRPNRIVSVATVALMLQVVFMYFFAYLMKSSPEWRVDGSAVYYALSLDMLVTPIGRLLREYPRLLRGLTFFVVGLEGMTPLLFFFPWRNAVCRSVLMLLMSGMHLGFLLCMWIELFPLICIVAWMAFLPSGFWDALARRCQTPQRRGLAIYYDSQSRLCRCFVLLLRTFLMLGEVRIRRSEVDGSIAAAAIEHNSWVLVDANGNRLFGFEALVELVRRSPAAWPLAWFLSWRWVLQAGRALFRFTAAHRVVLGYLTCPVRAWRPVLLARIGTASSRARWLLRESCAWTLWLLAQAFVSVWIVYILAYNIENKGIHTLQFRAFDEWFDQGVFAINTDPLSEQWDVWHLTDWLHQGWTTTFNGRPQRCDFYTVGRELRLEQYWAMFAPPLRDDGWYVMSARLADGTHIDLWTGQSVDETRPADPAAKFPNYRWFKYMERFINPGANLAHQPVLCQYLCRQWNESHEQSKRVRELQILFITEPSRPRYFPQEHRRVLITECKCEPAEAQDQPPAPAGG